MDITLTEIANAASTFVFPSLPDSIDVRSSTRYETYSLIRGGEVKLPNGTEVETISWKAVFYGESKKTEVMIRQWEEPKSCVSKLKTWQQNGTPLRLLVTNTDINIDVTISDLKCTETGAFGNIEYDIDFNAYRAIKVYTTEEKGVTTAVTTPRPSNTKTETTAAAKTYTIKSGDTLWAIAKRNYGNGAEYTKIYNANKDLIEKVAKQHKRKSSDNGHWIYPGTTITIP